MRDDNDETTDSEHGDLHVTLNGLPALRLLNLVGCVICSTTPLWQSTPPRALTELHMVDGDTGGLVGLLHGAVATALQSLHVTWIADDASCRAIATCTALTQLTIRLQSPRRAGQLPQTGWSPLGALSRLVALQLPGYWGKDDDEMPAARRFRGLEGLRSLRELRFTRGWLTADVANVVGRLIETHWSDFQRLLVQPGGTPMTSPPQAIGRDDLLHAIAWQPIRPDADRGWFRLQNQPPLPGGRLWHRVPLPGDRLWHWVHYTHVDDRDEDVAKDDAERSRQLAMDVKKKRTRGTTR